MGFTPFNPSYNAKRDSAPELEAALSKQPSEGHILPVMTKLLEEALEAVRRLPPKSQDEIAHAMLHLAARGGAPEPVAPAHLAAVLEGLAQAQRREFASDTEVEAAFRRFDR